MSLNLLNRLFFTGLAAITILTPVFAENTKISSPSSATVQSKLPPSQSKLVSVGKILSEGKINLNLGKGKDFIKIKGINPAKARAILTYRKKYGNFKSVEELAKIKSFTKLKPEELKEIQDKLVV